MRIPPGFWIALLKILSLISSIRTLNSDQLKTGSRVSNFFRIKDTTPFELRSRVVYEFTCVGCHSNYIGQTRRHLRHRMAEHKGVSHLTGKVMKSQSHSSIRDHSLFCNSCDCSSSNLKS